jgi:hypothetical protein
MKTCSVIIAMVFLPVVFTGFAEARINDGVVVYPPGIPSDVLWTFETHG